MKTINFKIGEHLIGDRQPCFVIAEIGSNHNQSLDLAYEHIDAAVEAGADAVKFQTFKASEHYSRFTPGFSYLNNRDTFSLIKELELNREWHSLLKKRSAQRGVEFFSSPCDVEAIEELARLEVCAYKVASFDLPDTQLIALMASKGKPVILSTGMADMEDIQAAVAACRAVGNEQVVLLQCTSLYPAPAQLSNLEAMRAMRASFGVLAGYSDHTMGDHIPLAAAAMGACMLEKHFTLSRKLPGPDHPFGIEPAELKDMIRKLREIEAAVGDGAKNGPRTEEREMYDKGRRSLHVAREIRPGEKIAANDLIVKRPGLGISPRLRDQVVGRTARVQIPADHWVTWDSLA
jgi:sialic acid synthase SpsE